MDDDTDLTWPWTDAEMIARAERAWMEPYGHEAELIEAGKCSAECPCRNGICPICDAPATE